MNHEFLFRLERAFIRLRRNGYFASHAFAWSQTSAWDAITWEEASQAVFYHEQDLRQCDESGGIYLAWNGDAAFICEALQRVGLTVIHDGKKGSRIRVSYVPEPEPVE